MKPAISKIVNGNLPANITKLVAKISELHRKEQDHKREYRKTGKSPLGPGWAPDHYSECDDCKKIRKELKIIEEQLRKKCNHRWIAYYYVAPYTLCGDDLYADGSSVTVGEGGDYYIYQCLICGDRSDFSEDRGRVFKYHEFHHHWENNEIRRLSLDEMRALLRQGKAPTNDRPK